MDDLLDLSWSSSPASKAPPAPLKPQSSSSFDFLSKPAPKTSDYQLPLQSRSATPTTAIPRPSGTSTLQLPSAPPTGTNDAFSSLFSLEPPKGSSAKLSLGERQAQMAAEQKKKEAQEREQFEAHGAFWDNLGGRSGPKVQNKGLDGLDDLLQPSLSSVPVPAQSITPTIIAPPAQPAKKSQMGSFWKNDMAQGSSKSLEDEDDGLLGFSSSTSQPKPVNGRSRSPSKAQVDLFDFDDMESAVPSLAVGGNSAKGGSSGMRTPVSDFDFGDQPVNKGKKIDAGLSNDDEEDHFDILGDLARPVRVKPAIEPKVEPSSHTRAGPSSPRRAPSPPPHIVGQIVEMGFSPSQARSALAKTSTGLDVEAALEILLGSTSNTARHEQSNEDLSDEDSRRERDLSRREEEERERRRRRRAGPSRDSVKPRHREDRDDVPTGTSTPEFGEQADRILAQASEIGQSVLSKATSFWNTGKERAMKAYEEQQKRAAELAKGRNGGEERKDGRPRWMTEVARDEGDEPEQGERQGFQDDEDEVLPQRPVSKLNGDETAKKASTTRKADNETPYRSVKERADLLFDDQPKSYRPANRHRKPASEAPRVTTPVRPSTPLITRQLVQSTPSQIAQSLRHKASGNEHYKLGRFTEASASYTSAITSLPEGNILLVPIYNNRAATRLKLGESSGAIEDCTVVIETIGIAYNPGKEAPLPQEYAEVKLGEGLVKAVTKRAQAWEMAEKWKSAVEDWERVLGFDTTLLGSTASATRNLAVEGVRRCKRMLGGGNAPKPSVTKAKVPSQGPSATVTTSTPADPDKSQAVTALRQANLATEAEDAQKLALKDSVDAKLAAWKTGKETNLRALISSLNTVLWDEILSGGLKVGMHELISEKQVKIKYMKVIARLHPDKLSVANTSVEQRMLANGAFGALNDAWQAFNNA